MMTFRFDMLNHIPARISNLTRLDVLHKWITSLMLRHPDVCIAVSVYANPWVSEYRIDTVAFYVPVIDRYSKP